MHGADDEDALVAAAVVSVARELSGRLDELTAVVTGIMLAQVEGLDDGQMNPLLHDCVRSVIGTVISASQHNIPLEQVTPPAAALEHARRLAQRGASIDTLLRAYRIGQKEMVNVVGREVRCHEMDTWLRLEAYTQITNAVLAYTDCLSQEAALTFQNEVSRWAQTRDVIRAARVHELLAGTAVGSGEAMTMAIRYPLERIHLAVVVWRLDSIDGGECVAMERFIDELVDSLEVREKPLYIPVDESTGWAWICLSSEGAPDAIARARRFAMARTDAPFLALGMPLSGVEGFRRSHVQALNAYTATRARGANTARVVSAADPGLAIATLLRGDVAAARTWVCEVLGPLASATESDERLRETLQVFLRNQSSFKAAGEELHLHPNSVKYRVRRAVERRGRAITADRLEIEVALLLCQWYRVDGR